MPYRLHIPGEAPKALRWTTAHPASHYGHGVLLYRNSGEILDGFRFRLLRDAHGAWIETARPDRARWALGLPEHETLGRGHAPSA